MQPERDTKAELNRRNQACEVLADTGIRVAEMDEHQGSAPCIPVWKTGVYLSTPMLGTNGIPCWNRTSLCGFANRRLNCSANGIEIESAGGSLHSRLRCYLVLASLNRSLFANKVRDYGRH